MTTSNRVATGAWTLADDERLRSLSQNRMHTLSIALQMKPTPSEIRRQASRLNILLRPERPQKQIG